MWLRLKALFRRRKLERELDDEMAFHLAMREQRLREGGVGADEAPFASRRRFGNAALIKEEARSMWTFATLETLWQDARYGVRNLRRSPAFAAVAILSLALGLGANMACFTVLNALLFKSLPVREPARLVEVPRSDGANVHTAAIWREIREREDVFSSVLAYGQTSFDVSSGGDTRQVPGLYVSGDYFRTLGISTTLGRGLDKNDDRLGAAAVCVLGYGFWQTQYGGDSGIIGRTLEIDGHAFSIVGVSPRGFQGLDTGESFDVMAPLASERLLHPGHSWLDSPQRWWLSVVGRLNPGISASEASARLDALAPAIFQASIPAGADPRDWEKLLSQRLKARPVPGGASYVRELYQEPLLLVMLMVGVVLLAACANIATLLMARSSARQREIATRLALGASRHRVVRQLLTESLLLPLLGAVPALAAARWGGGLLVRAISSPHERYVLNLSADARVWTFAAGILLASAVLFGVAPAMRAADMASFAVMKGGSGAAGERRPWMGRGTTVAQVALSVLLLVGAGLLARTLQKLLAQDLGYQPEGLLEVHTTAAGPSAAGDELLSAFRGMPGVVSAARMAPAVAPFTSLPSLLLDRSGGRQVRARSIFFDVSPGYFRTLRNSLIAGRDFEGQDTAGAPAVAILNQSAARAFFGGNSPVGMSFRLLSGDGQRTMRVEVIGIARNARFGRPDQEPPPLIYRPLAQDAAAPMGTYFLRFHGPLGDLTAHARDTAHSVDARIGLEFETGTASVRDVLQRERLTAEAASVFGGLALLMAAIGIYGVTSYTVARRTREIGIRMALGAKRGEVVRMILGETAKLVAAGIVLGVPAALAAARMARGMLFGVTTADPVSFVIAGVVMGAVALLAGSLPARRASRVDPMVALRYE